MRARRVAPPLPGSTTLMHFPVLPVLRDRSVLVTARYRLPPACTLCTCHTPDGRRSFVYTAIDVAGMGGYH